VTKSVWEINEEQTGKGARTLLPAFLHLHCMSCIGMRAEERRETSESYALGMTPGRLSASAVTYRFRWERVGLRSTR